jgi:hypothetical protein
MEEIEGRMREVLVQLELVSNGRTASFDVAGSSDPDWTPALGAGDAPHLHYAAWWNSARDDGERQQCLDAARRELLELRHSRGDRRAEESKVERDARIVEKFEGIEAHEVAIRVRCGLRDVWAARDAAGRDRDFGRKPREGPRLDTTDRRAEVERLDREGMSAAQIAFTLGVHYDTVRRDVGRKSTPA